MQLACYSKEEDIIPSPGGEFFDGNEEVSTWNKVGVLQQQTEVQLH